MATLVNTYHHRKVAESAAKACWICYKPSSSVLTTPDNKDFFYICHNHLKDRHFCTPDAEEATAFEKRRKDAEMEKEIEAVKKEYAEKMKKKVEKRNAKKGKDKDKEEKREDEKKQEEEDKSDEKEKDDKINAIKKGEATTEDGPRIYSLHKSFHQKRIERMRNAEIARRNRDRLKDPNFFPSVPGGDL